MPPIDSPILDSLDDSTGATLVVRARWYSVERAARLLGISSTAVRKRITSGELTSIRAGRSRRVLLLGDVPGVDNRRDRDDHPIEQSIADNPRPVETPARSDELAVLARTSESLTGLVRELQRQSLALAGQIGYLQHQLVAAQDRVKLLEQNPPAEVVGTQGLDREQVAGALTELQGLHQELAELREQYRGDRETAKRARWRFWRR